MKAARAANEKMGNQQPKGNLNLERYEKEGWYGAGLQAYEKELDEPLSNDDIVRHWLLTQIHVHNARLKLGGMAVSSVA